MRKKLRNIMIGIQKSLWYRIHIGPKLSKHLVFDRTVLDDQHFFYCSKNKRVIGHLYLYHAPDPAPGGGWWIYALSVRRLYRHLNIGSTLVNHVFEFLRDRKDCRLRSPCSKRVYGRDSILRKTGILHPSRRRSGRRGSAVRSDVKGSE